MRGKKSKTGNTRVAPNGYHYTRTKTGWRLTHHVVAEKTLGRLLKEEERVYFKDGDRTNIDPSNLEIRTTKPKTPAAKRAQLEAKIDDLRAQLEALP